MSFFLLADRRAKQSVPRDAVPPINLEYQAAMQSPPPAQIDDAGSCTCIGCSFGALIHDCPLCNYTRKYWWECELRKHFKTHFKTGAKFQCPQESCKTVFNKWADLKRHSNVHCTRPELFDCPVPYCHRKGDYGFPRKDKMMDHKKAAHREDIFKQPPKYYTLAPQPGPIE